jgi:hypothetical protein
MNAFTFAKPPVDPTLRDILIELDRAEQVASRLRTLAIERGRERWREQGMLGTPRIESLRMEMLS